jgi:hypothetical protein
MRPIESMVTSKMLKIMLESDNVPAVMFSEMWKQFKRVHITEGMRKNGVVIKLSFEEMK